MSEYSRTFFGTGKTAAMRSSHVTSAPTARSAAGLPCQPRRLKLQAAGFVRPTLLLGFSEKSPRQGARAGVTMLITRVSPEGDRSRWCADRAASSIWRQRRHFSLPPRGCSPPALL
jgi:hypothetical protein